MRLTCPKCDAEYDIPDRVIPLTGRDVQCSNCGKTWFFAHPGQIPDEEETTPAPAELPPAPPRRKLDPSVAEILREEAEREARLRDSETASQETPAPAEKNTHETRARQALLQDSATPPVNRLPDIEAIGSTLTAENDVILDIPDRPARTGAGGFTRGFALAVILAVLLGVAYFNARSIRASVPQAAPYLDLYVAKVDEGRVWIDGLINQYLAK